MGFVAEKLWSSMLSYSNTVLSFFSYTIAKEDCSLFILSGCILKFDY